MTGQRQNRGFASITGHAQELSLAMHPKFNELYLDKMF